MSEKRKQGLPAKFVGGKRSLAIDLTLNQYADLEDAVLTLQQKGNFNQTISKCMVVRAALMQWFESGRSLRGELSNDRG